MKIHYLYLESLARIEDLLINILNIAAKDKIKEHKKSRASLFKENWLDKQEVLQILKIGERTLFNLRKEKKLPCKFIGGKLYFSMKDIENLMSHISSSSSA